VSTTPLDTARPEPFDSPLILSLSKDERLAQDTLVKDEPFRSPWFDRLTTSVYRHIVLTTLDLHPEARQRLTR
jgi:hypothetical protein